MDDFSEKFQIIFWIENDAPHVFRKFICFGTPTRPKESSQKTTPFLGIFFQCFWSVGLWTLDPPPTPSIQRLLWDVKSGSATACLIKY